MAPLLMQNSVCEEEEEANWLKEELRISNSSLRKKPHKYVIGIQKKGKVKVLQQTYRTATRTQRDGAHWGKGSWRNGGCPNQTAPLFPLLLYSFPHSPLPETTGAFQISLGSPFLPPKLGYSSRRKQESISAASILGVSCPNLYYFQQFLHLSISQFRSRLWLWCLSFLLSKKNKSC